MLDALLLLALHLLLHLPLQFRFLPAPLECRLPRGGELDVELPHLVLPLQAELLLSVQLLCHAHRSLLALHGLPVAPPRTVRSDERGLGQLGARRPEQVLAAALLDKRVVPRHPAAREVALADAADGHLFGVLDALELLSLERRLHLPPLLLRLALQPPLEPLLLQALIVYRADALLVLRALTLESNTSLLDGELGLVLRLHRPLLLLLQFLLQCLLLAVHAYELLLQLLTLVAHAASGDEHLALIVPLLAGRLARLLAREAGLHLRAALTLERLQALLALLSQPLLRHTHRLSCRRQLRLQLI